MPVHLETIDPVGWILWENKNQKENTFLIKLTRLIQFLNLHAGF